MASDKTTGTANCVYILANKYNSVFYTGVTNNIFRRMYEHKSGLKEGFAKKYNCNRLVFYTEVTNIKDAIVLEKKLKMDTRKEKLRIIKQQNPGMIDLSEGWEFGELGIPLLYKNRSDS